jgi:hypothetical protein
MMRSRCLMALIVFAGAAHAGGSAERVLIASLDRKSATEFVLVVHPRPTGQAPADPYMGGCTTFTIHGNFERLRGSWFRSDPHATREAHIKALAYLEGAAKSKDWVALGWMGNGYVAIDEKDPCTVRSRALVMFDEGQGPMVLSYHDAT